jgi:4-amino-4-deoxy-L-arabinose transferase-like glycosyltransferase
MRSRRAIANSKTARDSRAVFFAGAALSILSAAAVWVVYAHGCTLYYGDADAHLMIARRVVDSQTPGYDQLGTGWLPMLHLLMLPLVRIDALWRNGLAGAIPVAACFVAAGCFLFAAVRRLFNSDASAGAAVALFALNPNVLYLQAIPMTEAVFFAALMGLLYFGVRFRETQGWGAAIGAGITACAATLTRYDGWFLLPFAATYFFFVAGRKRIFAALVFCAIAGLGPLYWLGHNWWMTGDWLDFNRGPYSARAIQGNATYPGLHDLRTAWVYYFEAARLSAGTLLLWIGIAGAAACILRRAIWPIVLLAIPPLAYVASVYSGAVPIFLPTLLPFSYYNARYGTSAIPLLAVGAAALVALAPRRSQSAAAAGIVLAGAGWWAFHWQPNQWVAWEESRVNSEGRRAWTAEAAKYLASRYVRGTGILTSSYPLTGVLREAGIPLAEALDVDNGLFFDAVVGRPELYPKPEWVLAQGGDGAQTAVNRAGRSGINYRLEKQIVVKGQPVIEIYRR